MECYPWITLEDLIGHAHAAHAGEDPVHEQIVDLLRVALAQASWDDPPIRLFKLFVHYESTFSD